MKTIEELQDEIEQFQRQKEIGMAQVEAYHNGIINYLQQSIEAAKRAAKQQGEGETDAA